MQATRSILCDQKRALQCLGMADITNLLMGGGEAPVEYYRKNIHTPQDDLKQAARGRKESSEHASAPPGEKVHRVIH